MGFAGNRARCGVLALVAVVSMTALAAPTAVVESPPPPTGYLWLDAAGRPLPFQDHTTIREVLRSARVVSKEPTARGVAGAVKLLLEHDEIRLHAVFRMVDVTEREQKRSARKTVEHRDAAIFEVAAYELSQLLGIDRVPPTVERRVGEQDGTVQIWMEETVPQGDLAEQNRLNPPDAGHWRRQKETMWVFDSLIANIDRNQGNILVDRSWTLWFIDHTRAFRESTVLLNRDKITTCERSLWTALREIDEEAIRQRLEPYLRSREISKLLTRRVKLVKHIQKQIDKHGENAVLFDVPPAGGS